MDKTQDDISAGLWLLGIAGLVMAHEELAGSINAVYPDAQRVELFVPAGGDLAALVAWLRRMTGASVRVELAATELHPRVDLLASGTFAGGCPIHVVAALDVEEEETALLAAHTALVADAPVSVELLCRLAGPDAGEVLGEGGDDGLAAVVAEVDRARKAVEVTQ